MDELFPFGVGWVVAFFACGVLAGAVGIVFLLNYVCQAQGLAISLQYRRGKSGVGSEPEDSFEGVKGSSFGCNPVLQHCEGSATTKDTVPSFFSGLESTAKSDSEESSARRAASARQPETFVNGERNVASPIGSARAVPRSKTLSAEQTRQIGATVWRPSTFDGATNNVSGQAGTLSVAAFSAVGNVAQVGNGGSPSRRLPAQRIPNNLNAASSSSTKAANYRGHSPSKLNASAQARGPAKPGVSVTSSTPMRAGNLDGPNSVAKTSEVSRSPADSERTESGGGIPQTVGQGDGRKLARQLNLNGTPRQVQTSRTSVTVSVMKHREEQRDTEQSADGLSRANDGAGVEGQTSLDGEAPRAVAMRSVPISQTTIRVPVMKACRKPQVHGNENGSLAADTMKSTQQTSTALNGKSAQQRPETMQVTALADDGVAKTRTTTISTPASTASSIQEDSPPPVMTTKSKLAANGQLSVSHSVPTPVVRGDIRPGTKRNQPRIVASSETLVAVDNKPVVALNDQTEVRVGNEALKTVSKDPQVAANHPSQVEAKVQIPSASRTQSQGLASSESSQGTSNHGSGTVTKHVPVATKAQTSKTASGKELAPTSNQAVAHASNQAAAQASNQAAAQASNQAAAQASNQVVAHVSNQVPTPASSHPSAPADDETPERHLATQNAVSATGSTFQVSPHELVPARASDRAPGAMGNRAPTAIGKRAPLATGRRVPVATGMREPVAPYAPAPLAAMEQSQNSMRQPQPATTAESPPQADTELTPEPTIGQSATVTGERHPLAAVGKNSATKRPTPDYSSSSEPPGAAGPASSEGAAAAQSSLGVQADSRPSQLSTEMSDASQPVLTSPVSLARGMGELPTTADLASATLETAFLETQQAELDAKRTFRNGGTRPCLGWTSTSTTRNGVAWLDDNKKDISSSSLVTVPDEDLRRNEKAQATSSPELMPRSGTMTTTTTDDSDILEEADPDVLRLQLLPRESGSQGHSPSPDGDLPRAVSVDEARLGRLRTKPNRREKISSRALGINADWQGTSEVEEHIQARRSVDTFTKMTSARDWATEGRRGDRSLKLIRNRVKRVFNRAQTERIELLAESGPTETIVRLGRAMRLVGAYVMVRGERSKLKVGHFPTYPATTGRELVMSVEVNSTDDGSCRILFRRSVDDTGSVTTDEFRRFVQRTRDELNLQL